MPLQPIHSMACAQYHIHSGLEHVNSHNKDHYNIDNLKARGLVNAFVLALGQAKLRFGPDVTKGELPSPVTVNFVTTDGCADFVQFCFAGIVHLADKLRRVRGNVC